MLLMIDKLFPIKNDPRLAGRIGGLKAEPVARLECFAETSHGSFREWKYCHPAIGPKDLRRGGRNLGTGFGQILAPPERGDQKSVFFGTSISGRKSDYPHALQALWKALDRAEDLIQN
jgi:hypothetical protein